LLSALNHHPLLINADVEKDCAFSQPEGLTGASRWSFGTERERPPERAYRSPKHPASRATTERQIYRFPSELICASRPDAVDPFPPSGQYARHE
jgi:hypothetical protein